MLALPAFDYSKGSAFIHEGYLYYSPNCKRPVVIPPRPNVTMSPFRLRHLAASQFRQPVWWSSNWGWLAFVPLQPTFTSLPFEPLSWMPPIISFYAPIRNSADIETQKKMFKMADDTAAIWLEHETKIVEAANMIRLRHSIQSIQPPLPSSFGFLRAHRSYTIAKQMILVSRNWFGILMGWFASIIAEAEASPFQKSVPKNALLPYWYRFLMNNGMSPAWLDGLQSSPVGSYNPEILRSGIVISWVDEEHKRPTLEFFYRHNIPLFFPWSAREEEQIATNPSLVRLRPPNELIQEALMFLTTSPNGLPLATYTMQCFFRIGQEENPLTKETFRVLRFRYSSSFVLKFVLQNFLSVEDALIELENRSDRDEALLREIALIPQYQHDCADAAALLPQQPMLGSASTTAGNSKGVIANWKEFFRSRARRYAEWLPAASDPEVQACENRRRQPPTVKTKMFVWDTVESPGEMTVYTRTRQAKSTFADLLEDDDERFYDPWMNEWDFFPNFIKDNNADPETGVPALRLASCADLRPMVYESDDDDVDDLAALDNISKLCTSSPSNLANPLFEQLPSRISSSHHSPTPPHHPSPFATSLSLSISQPMAIEINDSEQVEEHPDVCKDMEETMQYMYGWRRSYGAQFPLPTSTLDWRGIEKAIGFSSTPIFQASESSSIINFISTLARGPKYIGNLTSDLHDLDPRNRDFLGNIFDFRTVLRLEPKMYIFHSPPSNACNWVLGAQSAVVALYIIRFLMSNSRQTILTIARHLLERGIPFRTLLYLRAESPNVLPASRSELQCGCTGYREVKYHFTVVDFESSVLACKSILNKIGRAALLRGGILGRIAREFLSIDSPLDGPSGWAAVDRVGFCVGAENFGHEYWDDELTETEIATICGTYTLYTGYGTQTKIVSWFPPPSAWDVHGFGWAEWTEASETLFTSLLVKIRRNNAQPRSKKEWRDVIRGFGATRAIIDANNLRANEFMDRYCPVRWRV